MGKQYFSKKVYFASLGFEKSLSAYLEFSGERRSDNVDRNENNRHNKTG